MALINTPPENGDHSGCLYKDKSLLSFGREGAATAGNSAQAGSGGPNPKMTLLLVFNIFRNSTFYTNVDYVPSFIFCNLVVGGSTGILVASRPF